MPHKMVVFDDRLIGDIVTEAEFEAYNPALAVAEKMLAIKSGPGNDFLGWLDLPTKTSRSLIEAIAEKAREIRNKADVLICIGIGSFNTCKPKQYFNFT